MRYQVNTLHNLKENFALLRIYYSLEQIGTNETSGTAGTNETNGTNGVNETNGTNEMNGTNGTTETRKRKPRAARISAFPRFWSFS